MPCELCGSSRNKDYFRRHSDMIVRCSGCGFLYALPRPDEKLVSTWYEGEGYFRGETEFNPIDFRRDDHRALATASAHERLAVIEQYVSRGRLLDVGTGLGHFLAAARGKGWEIAGIDISPFAMQFLKEKLGIEPHRTLQESNYAEGSFNAVTMWEYLEHVLHPIDDLMRVARLLVPGGILAMSTPNAGSVRARWEGSRSSAFGCPAHINFFTPRTMRLALSRAGFRLMRLEGRDIRRGQMPLPLSDGVQKLRQHLGSWSSRLTPFWWVTSASWMSALAGWLAVEKLLGPLLTSDNLWAYAKLTG